MKNFKFIKMRNEHVRVKQKSDLSRSFIFFFNREFLCLLQNMDATNKMANLQYFKTWLVATNRGSSLTKPFLKKFSISKNRHILFSKFFIWFEVNFSTDAIKIQPTMSLKINFLFLKNVFKLYLFGEKFWVLLDPSE